jgi:hypothetical protein
MILSFPPATALSSPALATDAAAPSAQVVLRQMAGVASDDCSPPFTPAKTDEVHQSEDLLFTAVDALVADRLNQPTPAPAAAAEARAKSALVEVERSSAENNNDWPSENRFHFQILDLHPAILVRMSYRDRARIVLFGSFNLGTDSAVDPGTKWREVSFPDPSTRASGIDLFPLHRSPSGRARFLAKVWRSGCAGSIGEDYYGYEWDGEAGQSPSQMINIQGAEGLDDTASKHVGKLSTSGKIITLPYCFFSAVDTWDNPTLCAADSFDLSGDAARFIGRIYNAPDLVVVNNAIRHAQARDHAALRAYCTSDAVANRLIRDIPPYLHADVLERIKAGRVRERIVLEEGTVHFNLVRSRRGWLLEGFRIADAP